MNSMNLIIPTPFSRATRSRLWRRTASLPDDHDFSTLHTTRNDGRMLSPLPPQRRATAWYGAAIEKIHRFAPTWVPASPRHASANEGAKYTRVSFFTARTFGAFLSRRSQEPRETYSEGWYFMPRTRCVSHSRVGSGSQ